MYFQQILGQPQPISQHSVPKTTRGSTTVMFLSQRLHKAQEQFNTIKAEKFVLYTQNNKKKTSDLTKVLRTKMKEEKKGLITIIKLSKNLIPLLRKNKSNQAKEREESESINTLNEREITFTEQQIQSLPKKCQTTINKLLEKIEKHKKKIKAIDKEDEDENENENETLKNQTIEEQTNLKNLIFQNNQLRDFKQEKTEQVLDLQSRLKKLSIKRKGKTTKSVASKLKSTHYKQIKLEINKLKFNISKMEKEMELQSNSSLQQMVIQTKMRLQIKTKENTNLEKELKNLQLKKKDGVFMGNSTSDTDYDLESNLTKQRKSILTSEMEMYSDFSFESTDGETLTTPTTNYYNKHKIQRGNSLKFEDSSLLEQSQDESHDQEKEEKSVGEEYDKGANKELQNEKGNKNDNENQDTEQKNENKKIENNNLNIDHLNKNKIYNPTSDNNNNNEDDDCDNKVKDIENNDKKDINKEYESEKGIKIKIETETETKTEIKVENKKNNSKEDEVNQENEPLENNYDLSSTEILFTIPTAVEYFKEYLFQEMCQENILFFLEVKEYKNSFVNEKKMISMANKIYKKYIKNGALFEVNIDYSCRDDITKKMNGKNIDKHIFDHAQSIVFIHMDHNQFGQFKSSKLYQELLKKVNSNDESQFGCDIKKATFIKSHKNIKVLNKEFLFTGKSRNACLVIEELMESMNMILNSWYSITSHQIEFDMISKSLSFNRFHVATTELQKVKLKNLNQQELLSFFINAYNLIMLHAGIVNGIPQDKNELRKFFNESKYNIGRMDFSLNDIFYGILRQNRGIKNRTYFPKNDPRSKIILKRIDPRMHFCLFSYDSQTIIIQTFFHKILDHLLEKITRFQISRNVIVKKKKIYLPKKIKSYLKDFGETMEKNVLWILSFLPNPKKQLNDHKTEQISIKFHKERFILPIFLLDTESLLIKKYSDYNLNF
ncbi:electron carrier/ protein disulfide oxidoreductase [Anaeramoeba flamelloides]|uniref:Electron carrier/ protein disulfide oxidoreductase n=1 Tax=Anaeramoeba flamelloides TaxID=1746091 RepID=A0AAV7YM49_9EUKA|nr:electron carrier/ protein disulfide oxidoreductase [Anaeramoeba flamelloides]